VKIFAANAFEGVLVMGKRTTTIPLGKVGNDRSMDFAEIN